MNIIEAYKEAKKSSYRIINANETRVIDFNHEHETIIKKYDELGGFLDVQTIHGLEDLYIRELLDIIADVWEVIDNRRFFRQFGKSN